MSQAKGAVQDKDAFFDAVGIDPVSIFASPMQLRLRQAVLAGDKAFLGRLGSVLKEPPKAAEFRETAHLHAALLLMGLAGALDRIKNADMAYELFVKQARIYKGTDSNVSAKENLWKHVRKAQINQRKKASGEKSS